MSNRTGGAAVVTVRSRVPSSKVFMGNSDVQNGLQARRESSVPSSKGQLGSREPVRFPSSEFQSISWKFGSRCNAPGFRVPEQRVQIPSSEVFLGSWEVVGFPRSEFQGFFWNFGCLKCLEGEARFQCSEFHGFFRKLGTWKRGESSLQFRNSKA